MSGVSRTSGKLPPFKAYRKLPADPKQRAAMKRHARQVGEIVYAWNSAHGAIFWVFWTLLGKGHAVAHGLWHSLQSDIAQRQLLEQLASNTESHTISIRKAASWLVWAMDELSPYRNAAAHVQMYYHHPDLLPSDSTSRPKYVERLSKSPVEKYWRKLRGDLRAIEVYAVDLHVAIMMKNARPYTHRPQLRLVLAKNAKSRRQNRQRSQAAQKSPPQSSRP